MSTHYVVAKSNERSRRWWRSNTDNGHWAYVSAPNNLVGLPPGTKVHFLPGFHEHPAAGGFLETARKEHLEIVFETEDDEGVDATTPAL